MTTLLRNENKVHRTFQSDFEQNYTILEFLGSGAFGTVYQCVPIKEKQRIVAIKLVEFQENCLDKAKKEAEILEKLDHPNVVKIFTHWSEKPTEKYEYPKRSPTKIETEGVLFIETEFCNLHSLERWFNQQIITRNVAKVILYQISHGVSYLHEKGIIHRDLKPPNILLCTKKESNSVVAKICDFGVSRVIDAKMTSRVGSFGYICPEASMQGGNYYTEKADIYALGVIFCEMLLMGCRDMTNFDVKDTEVVEAKYTATGFIIPSSCHKNISVEEKSLIERMVKVPFGDRLNAFDIINELKTMHSDIDDHIIPIPDMQKFANKEKFDEFRLYGDGKSCKIFTDIPAEKLQNLTAVDLNYVSIKTSNLTANLSQCPNLKSIDLNIINEDDEFFEKIHLPNLKRFFFRQLNGSFQIEHLYEYITKERFASILFFGPLSQIWEKEMAVQVVITNFVVVDIRQDEKVGCDISLTTNAGTECLYDALHKFKNVNSVYALDHLKTSQIRLDLKKIPSWDKIQTLAIALPTWNNFVNYDIQNFSRLSELYLCSYSQAHFREKVYYRRHLDISKLPKSVKRLTLDEVQISYIPSSILEFDTLTIVTCNFLKRFEFENMDPSNFRVKKINIFSGVLHEESTEEEIYKPTWELLNFLLSADHCESFYFGSFDWNLDSPFKKEYTDFLIYAGVPNNNRKFRLEMDTDKGEWKGTVIEVREECENIRKYTHTNKIILPEKEDEFRPPKEERMNSTVIDSWIPFFQEDFGNVPYLFLNGRTETEDFRPFVRLTNKGNMGKVHLKHVLIQGRSFVQNLKGCNQLVSLSLENVKVTNDFVGFVNLSALKEVNIMISLEFNDLLEISKFFNRERLLSTLFFNENSFQNLWSRKINCLVGISNRRLLEFDHKKGSVIIQFSSSADEIISESGMCHPNENVQSIVLFLSPLQITTIPCFNLKYLNLTLVDVNIMAIFESQEFPSLETFFFEPINHKITLDISIIPPSVKTVGLTGLTLRIGGQYDTCDCLTISNCTLPRDFPEICTTMLSFRKIALIGGRWFFPTCKFLRALILHPTKKCESIYVSNFLWKIQIDEVVLALLMSMGFDIIERNSKFELTRSRTNREWTSRNIDKNPDDFRAEGKLTGIDIVPRNFVTLPHEILPGKTRQHRNNVSRYT